jgi:hypothetical protein
MSFFDRFVNQLTNAAKVKAERATVDKVDAKIGKAQAEAQNRALGAMNKAERGINDKVKGTVKKGKGNKAEAAAEASHGPVPVNQAYAPVAGGGGEVRPMAGALTCPNGHPLDPTWEVCPYCRAAAQQGVPVAQYSAPGATGGKTMAINPEQLLHTQHVNKPVVGWIVCMSGQQKGQDFRLHDGKNIIGTAADCDIVIYDPYVGARHAVLLIESGDAHYVLQDLDSKNGSYVNRVRVAKQDLVDNDELRLGQVEFRFKALY